MSGEQYQRVTVRMIVERIAPMAIGSSLEKRGSSSRQVVDWWSEKVISAIQTPLPRQGEMRFV
jgi:hypothetical protein